MLVAVAVLLTAPLVALVSIAVFAGVRFASGTPGGLEWALASGTALGLMCLLACLAWSMGSEPMSKLVSLIGARLAKGEELEGKRLLENLAIGAGLPQPRFYVLDTVSPNALAAGMDPEHSAVVVTAGLLQLLDTRELEGVLAHELSHIGNRDTRLNTMVAAIALFLRIPYLLQKPEEDDGTRVEPPFTPFVALAKFVVLPLQIYLFFILPVAAMLIRAAVSQNREFLADADAALLTRYPEGLMRALAKIAGAGSGIPGTKPSVAHLYFANPSPNDQVSAGNPLADDLLATHPPISQRIAILAKLEGGVPESEIAAAVKAGEEFRQKHQHTREDRVPALRQSELSVFTQGNPSGRAFRLVGATAPVPVYDKASVSSRVVAHVMPGDLLVVFDGAGPMRQVLTYHQTYGYLTGRVRLQRVDILPEEVFNADSRQAVLAELIREKVR